MKKRWFAFILALYMLFIFALIVNTGEKNKISKLGILAFDKAQLEKAKGLKDVLEKSRYNEGENIVYTIMNAERDLDKLPLLAEELLRNNPDILIALGTEEAKVLKDATSKLSSPPPIVFVGAISPTAVGLIEYESKSASNLTGLDGYQLELTPKRLELLKFLVPKIKRVALLGDKNGHYQKVEEAVSLISRELELKIDLVKISSKEEIEKAFLEFNRDFEAIVLLPGVFTEANIEPILNLANQRRLPVVGLYPEDVDKGCLIAYGATYYDQGFQAAQLVYRLLRGTKPHRIPVENPDNLTLIINQKIANQIGVALSPEALSFADRIIEPSE